MAYQITNARLWVRDIGAPRMDFVIGKGVSLFPEWMRINVEAELHLEDDKGRQAVGCSADWPSFGWLDKRAEVAPRQKLADLLALLEQGRACLPQERWESPFDAWWGLQTAVTQHGQEQSSVPLCLAFATALWERALLDAFCRINELSFYDALSQNQLGLALERIHPELAGFDWQSRLPKSLAPTMHVRHTVGPLDPLNESDRGPDRPQDELPHTLEEYVQRSGITHFKIKIGGQPDADLERLQRIWSVVREVDPVITLDGNEAYAELAPIGELLDRLEADSPDLARHIRFIEQPANRAATLEADPAAVAKIAARVPLVIDEADGYLHAFRDAVALGYRGVSHKNCKGVIKSIANFAFCQYHSDSDRVLFQTAEDLTNLPLIALHQDLVVAGSLGLTDAERNGHHFFGSLNHLSSAERDGLLESYPGLYEDSDQGPRLRVTQGRLDVQCLATLPGLGLKQPTTAPQRHPLEDWLAAFEV